MPGTLFYLPRAVQCCSTLPGTRRLRTNLVMLRGTKTDSSLQARCQELLKCEVPMEHAPTIQTWSQENHLTNTALASAAQGGHSCVFFCQYIWDSYTPIENLSPFIHSSSSLQGCDIKHQNRSLPEKTLHLHSNVSECGLQKY